MKKKLMLLSLCLCAALLVMSACQSAPAPSEPPEEPPVSSQGSPVVEPPSPESQPEPAAAVPDDSANLTVALRVTAPEADGYPSGELGYSTQADADACRQWLYGLKAGDITALYGVTMPLDRYWTGEMSLEDSRRIVDLLRSVAPGLAPLEGGNPPTGGGWEIAVHTGDEAVSLGFNGEWVTFIQEGKGWILDGTSASVRESCNEIEALLSKYASPAPAVADAAPVVTETYFPEDVQSIYALDKDSYVMARVEDGYAASKTIWEGLENRVSSGGEPSGYGFLIFTAEGKEYVYLEDTDEDMALNKACQAALINGPLHPSWLIHMTPERMVSVEGLYGTLDGAEVTDRDELLAFAKFLKEEVTVKKGSSAIFGFNNFDAVGGMFTFKITFDSGVEYFCGGYDEFDGTGSISIHTSDLNQFVMYGLNNGVAGRITAFLGSDW